MSVAGQNFSYIYFYTVSWWGRTLNLSLASKRAFRSSLWVSNVMLAYQMFSDQPDQISCVVQKYLLPSNILGETSRLVLAQGNAS